MMSITKTTVVAALLATSQLASGADLVIEVDGIRNTDGSVWIILHTDPVDFSKQKDDDAPYFIKMPAREGKVSVTLDVPPGQYAGSVMHDENNNGMFDQEGVNPLEGYGYTNNLGQDAIPTFKDASVSVDQNGANSRISLIYMDSPGP